MSDIDSTRLLTELRAMATMAQGKAAPAADQASGADFSSMLKTAVDKVNDTQQNAGKLAQAFEVGDPKVGLPEVMVALQKANVSFQAMVQVRNKLVSAYQDVMNMQV